MAFKGFKKFKKRWRKRFPEIRETSLTKEEARGIYLKFRNELLSLIMRNPKYEYTFEVEEEISALENELKIAISKARAKERKRKRKFQKAIISKISDAIKEFFGAIKEFLRTIKFFRFFN